MVWMTPMTMPTNPSIEPIDRSMLRVTITSTMPVAMIATDDDCTERFQRLRGVRKSPPESNMENDPDQQQRADEAKHPRVEFSGFEKASERTQGARPGIRGRRLRLAHWRPPAPGRSPPPDIPS